MATRLIIARHGNTFDPGDVIRRVGARTDLPLSSSGQAQAAKLGAHLRSAQLLPDTLYVSTLKRTQQTAKLAMQAANHVLMPEISERFDEIDYGPDEGQPEDAVIARLGKQALQSWDGDGVVPDGWQVDPAALGRMWHDFAASLLRDQAGITTMVVTSNGIARFAPLIAGPMTEFKARYVPKLGTAAYGVLNHDGSAWRIENWNIKAA